MATIIEQLMQDEISRSIIGIVCGFILVKLFIGTLKLLVKLVIVFLLVYAMLWSLDLHDIIYNLQKTFPRMNLYLDPQSSVMDIIVNRMMFEVDLKANYWNSFISGDVNIITGSFFGMALGFLF